MLGFDGVSFDLLSELACWGVMPNVAALLNEGFGCEMTSTMPPVSSTAWTTCTTGVNPAGHGIFGFMERRRESYGIYFPNASHVKAPTLWDILSDKGLKTVAVNIPHTYPARETNGILISGFAALDLESAVYPRQLVDALRRIDYRVDVDVQHAPADPAVFFKDLTFSLNKRRETCSYLMNRTDWDLFMVVFTGPERLMQYFWRDIEDTSSVRHKAVMEYFRSLDDAVGEMTGKFGDDVALLMVSDHGFGRLRHEVYLNEWLLQHGLLAFMEGAEPSFENIDGRNTKAFVLDPGRVYVNLKGTMPQGCVEPGEEYEQLIKELNSAFFSLKNESTGEPVISSVFRRQDIYGGPLLEKSPDLVLWGAPGYSLKGMLSSDGVQGFENRRGMHTYSDAFFYMRGLQGLQRRPRIEDVAPTVLHLLRVPVPDDMDGKALV